jgi:cellulose synthase/poly-beta-1,6-N-acetylglucosamine synthase-like glycosyltransferase
MMLLPRAARWSLLAAQATIVSISLYQSLVTALGYARRGRPHRTPALASRPRFGLIVCARNEAHVVERIVRDLYAQEYPRELFDVIVVAHNCSDDTASAAARAGAFVVVHTTSEPGKARAVEAGIRAFGRSQDLVGIFDADARVEPGLLGAVAQHAGEDTCLQAETVPIEDPEWLAAGYGFGRKARNLFWWRPREALGLGTTISGCGWFIRPELLHRYIEGSHTLTEDLELTARLYADGHRVAYLSAARVAVGEPRELATSVRQRLRWVRGHLGVLRWQWPRLAARAIRGDFRALDMALYILVPTRMLTRIGTSIAVLLALLRLPFALPLGVAGFAAAAEWGVPAYIGWRERLVALNITSLSLAARHSILSLLWFPIGFWALVTARVRAWDATPRPRTERANVP